MTGRLAAGCEHAATIVGHVAEAAIIDCGATGILVLDGTSPEGGLVVDWLRTTLGPDRVFDSSATEPWPVPVALVDDPVATREAERAAARVFARDRGLLLAHPASKTVLLLAGWPPPERFLPLGDLYASAVAELAGACALPVDVDALANAAGGLARLDGALYEWLEMRRPLADALLALPPDARPGVHAALRRNRGLRRWPRCVPKLGIRTLWTDVFA